MTNQSPPTLQEQAQAYAGTKIDGKYPGPVQAFLAGHASRNEEIDQLESSLNLLKEVTIVELREQVKELEGKLQEK